jgi:hypothetical protein
MSEIRKYLDLINETTAGATASGSVATVAQPMQEVQKRVKEDDRSKAPEVIEYGNWENSALTTSNELKKSRKKAAKIVKSIYGEDDESQKKEVKEGVQRRLTEGASQEDVANAIAWRIDRRHPELFTRYGVEFVNDVIQDVASFHEGAEELGSSDISAMVGSVIKQLEERSDDDVTEGRFVKGPGGVPLDRQGNPKLPKPPTPTRPKVADQAKLTSDVLDMIWRKVENVVSQVYPDADPIDLLVPWFESKGISGSDIGDMITQAAKKHGYKDLYDYWDSMGELYSGDREVSERKNLAQQAAIAIAKKKKKGVSEGYSLKKTRVEKTFTPGDPDEYYTSGGADVTTKDTDYEIINNKTGNVVGTASWTTNDYFGAGALKITMKNGATRYIDIWEREKGNPQSAFNRFIKDPKTAKKYKDEDVAEADKHSFVGKIQRGHELKKKVDSTFKDIGDAQKKGDKEAGSNAFRKHERYANLERPGTWTKSKEQGVAEGSEWETRHDEFVTVGDRATPEQINKIVSALDVAAKKASSKRGFLNQIFGKQSNGDLARIAHGAETLAKNIQRISNAKPGTDERKELGQQLVYAVSLLKRMSDQQGVAEGYHNNVMHAWNSGMSDEEIIQRFGKSEFDRLKKKYDDGSIPVPDLLGYKPKEPEDKRVRLHRGLEGPGKALKSIIKQQGVTESQTAKAGIVQTEVYGTKAYHAKCMEQGCDWESKRYDRIQQAQAAAKKHAEKHFDKQGVAEGSLNEFFQGSGGGESGRWYTDDEMTDIVGDGWWQDMDVSGANIGVIDSEVPKEYMIQQAQAWLDDQGYSVQVLNCKVNDDDMEWYIEGSFQNSGFAKKGVAEGIADMEWHGSNNDMGWYDAYKDQPVRVKVKNHSGLGSNPSGTFNIRSFKKIGPSKAELTIRYRMREMTGTVDLDNPETVVNKMYDRVPAMNFYIGSMPVTPRQAFNLFQHKNKKKDVTEGSLKKTSKKVK